jgi:hypothetical protein|tara:strand:+ start:767 stop:1054 length:288 start_codon:yes stop_codon:yes gene_type:complete
MLVAKSRIRALNLRSREFLANRMDWSSSRADRFLGLSLTDSINQARLGASATTFTTTSPESPSDSFKISIDCCGLAAGPVKKFLLTAPEFEVNPP